MMITKQIQEMLQVKQARLEELKREIKSLSEDIKALKLAASILVEDGDDASAHEETVITVEEL